MKIEAAIVGAGPAGLIAARELARRGFEVKVYEEHIEIGEPNHCTGILSVEGLRRLDIDPNNDFILHEVSSGKAFSPNNTCIMIASGRTRAYIVDRGQFDRYLAEKAIESGAEIEVGHRIKEISMKSGKVVGIKGDINIDADVVINTEGATGSLAKKIGFPRPKKGILAGVNVDVSDVETNPGMVEIWLGESLAPGLFAWTVPVDTNKARCGLATRSGDALKLVRVFVERRFGIKEISKVVRWPVITGGPVQKTFTDGLLLVGDVAGHVKPTTGGGVILGGMCAIIAAETAAECLEKGNTSADSLMVYEERWRRTLGREFSSMLGARRFVNGISDVRLDRIFHSMKTSGLEPTLIKLVEEGDMDLQSGILRKVLSHPSMLRVLAESMGRIALMELRTLLYS